MALTKCADCGHDVSSLAPACLNCGRPVLPPAPHSGGSLPRQRRRWVRGLFFAVVLGVLGYYSTAIIEGSIFGAVIGALIGAIVGFLLGGRKTTTPKKSFSIAGSLGIILAIVGLIVSYIAYTPPMFKAIAVYPNGQISAHPGRFKTEQECATWVQNQSAMMSEQLRINPNTRGYHTLKCQANNCSSKFDCAMKNIMSSF